MLLDIQNVKKVYGMRKNQVTALRDMNFMIAEGEFVAIMGESGSGKSTLLNLIATFDKQTEGTIILNNHDTIKLKGKEIAKFRREQLGFVFQDFNVLHTMNIKDNILLPLVLSDTKMEVMSRRLSAVTKELGIDNILEKYPYEISGGQKQRVAIARAIISQPRLLLADEPTGALDSKTSRNIMNLFRTINEQRQTVLMVTHSTTDASYAKRVIFIKDGLVYHEIYRGEEDQSQFQKRIADSLAMISESEV
ncbi:ABC transporter ATP-binding protein [Staphylococcus sp. SQ8-PEA]|uniref:ABC transporter ATP-binding protein n=1 Tax=Staphylococcus marylandisciuri TaxID=2981529 RepID=A0ABT2QQF3_9STAP|nr:ABC transporter ATP-binding protein [Staphylococcus marylandisciuri]MCU5746203.1 ABC transporter ATP-binding protein [Staphylococcus marylandisciuri]